MFSLLIEKCREIYRLGKIKIVLAAALASNLLYASMSPTACEQMKKNNPKAYETLVKAGSCGENSEEAQKKRAIEKMADRRYSVSKGALACRVGGIPGFDDISPFLRDGTCVLLDKNVENLKLVNYTGVVSRGQGVYVLKLQNDQYSFWVEERLVKRTK